MFLVLLGFSNFGVIIFDDILVFLVFISAGFRAGVIISTFISLIFCFYFSGIPISFGHLRLYFAHFFYFGGIPISFGPLRLYFAYFLFLFWWNSNIFWSSSPVFWDYSNEASRRNHRFYEISSFCQFGLTVFS